MEVNRQQNPAIKGDRSQGHMVGIRTLSKIANL